MRILFVLIYFFVSVFLLGLAETYWSLGYLLKSGLKVFLFGVIPLMCFLLYKKNDLRNLFSAQKTLLLKPLIIGITLYALIVSSYLFLQNLIDFSSITTSLENSVGVNVHNFVFVAIYISFVNSFLEEFFFRGFGAVFLKLKNKWVTYSIVSAIFALYHVSMMIGWYDIWIFVAAIVGLFVVGLFLHILREKFQSLYASWIVHGCCNLGINTVGMILFGII